MIQLEVTSGFPCDKTETITDGAPQRAVDDSWSESVILWSAARRVLKDTTCAAAGNVFVMWSLIR